MFGGWRCLGHNLVKTVVFLERKICTTSNKRFLLPSRRFCSKKLNENDIVLDASHDRTQTSEESDPERRFEAVVPENRLETAYTSAQQALIIKILNESTFEELQHYSLSKTRAKKIIQYRNKHGYYTNITSVLEVDGFGVTVLEKLCDIIAYGTGDQLKTYPSARKLKSLIKTTIPDEIKQSLQSVVAIRLTGTNLIWLHLTRDRLVLDWELYPLDTITYNSPAHTNLQLVNKVCALLPRADAYLIEQRSYKVRHLDVVPALCSLLQIESMLMAKINHDNRRVFVLNGTVVSNFFKLRLGNENISGKKVVDNLLSELPVSKAKKVVVDEEKLKWYYQQGNIDREHLGNCLLMAIAFYEVELIRVNKLNSLLN